MVEATVRFIPAAERRDESLTMWRDPVNYSALHALGIIGT